jgi:probable HAF family extracellular repeat protein
MVDLGAIGGGASHALFVNDRGQVTGTTGGGGAFLWSAEDGMRDLGSLGGGGTTPSAIGPTGQIVGVSVLLDPEDPLARSDTHAFSWTKRGGMVDLGTLPGGSQSAAHAVSANGLVAGASTTGIPGEWRPVLWTPGR